MFSTFMKTQTAAIFGTGIVTVMPAIQFSGLLSPVSSLSGGASVMSYGFPSTYFQQISVGTFTKALVASDLIINYAALAALHRRVPPPLSGLAQDPRGLIMKQQYPEHLSSRRERTLQPAV